MTVTAIAVGMSDDSIHCGAVQPVALRAYAEYLISVSFRSTSDAQRNRSTPAESHIPTQLVRTPCRGVSPPYHGAMGAVLL